MVYFEWTIPHLKFGMIGESPFFHWFDPKVLTPTVLPLFMEDRSLKISGGWKKMINQLSAWHILGKISSGFMNCMEVIYDTGRFLLVDNQLDHGLS